MYTYREGCDATGTLTDNHLHHRAPPSPAHVLLSDSTDDEERFDSRFGGGVRGGGAGLPPAYQIAHRGRGGGEEEEELDVYLDDDMESQRDGSVISRTAIYV